MLILIKKDYCIHHHSFHVNNIFIKSYLGRIKTCIFVCVDWNKNIPNIRLKKKKIIEIIALLYLFIILLFIYLFIILYNDAYIIIMIFTNILLNKFHDFSNEETIHLANAIEVIWISLVILVCVIARARPHTRPKGFARAILSVQLMCEICYYMCKCAMYRTPSNFFIDKTVEWPPLAEVIVCFIFLFFSFRIWFQFFLIIFF